MQKIRNMKGFTLVEVAIVLVIVGLVIFGVLKGQEMVKQGKIKKVMNQKNDLTAAVFTYQDKKGGKLPGAATLPSQIDSYKAFKDLADANLISGTFTSPATDAEKLKTPYGGFIDIAYVNPLPDGKAKNSLVFYDVPEEVVYQLDVSQDDGVETAPGPPPTYSGGTTGSIQYTVVAGVATLYFVID